MLDDDELIGILNAHRSDAVGFFESEVVDDLKKALDYYNGAPFGDEEDGRSQVISRDVAEVVDGIMPDLMRIFASGDKVVFFKPTNESDVPNADQATDYINHLFWNENNGFEVLYDFAKEGLLQKNGVVKVWWEEKEDRTVETFRGLSVVGVGLLEEEDLEIVTKDEEDTIPSQDFPDGKIYAVTVERVKAKGHLRIESIPSEEFLISPRAVSIDDSPYKAHRPEKTLADLVAEGLISKEDAEDLPITGDFEFESRRDARHNQEQESSGPEEGLMRVVEVLDEYVTLDTDDDGLAEMRHIIRVGNEILVNEVVDDHPFADWTPNRMPHRWRGRSTADDVIDIQRIDSVLLRQMLDNLYLANNPRKYVNMQRVGDTTIDDMLNDRVGGIIRGEGPLQDVVGEFTTPYVAQGALTMLEYLEGKKEQRTGHVRLNQGLDSETLNQTATGITKLMAAAQGRKELIARRLAIGVAKIFKKSLVIITRYQDRKQIIRLRDKFVPIDPRHWNANMDVDVMVGLGTGNKEQHVQNLQLVMAIQKEAASTGYAESAEMRAKMFNTFSDIVESMGLPSVERYMPNPETPEGQVTPPGQLEAETMLEVENIRAKARIQVKEMDSKLDLIKLQTESELKMLELGVQGELKVMEIEAEAFLAGAGMEDTVENSDAPNVDTRINVD
jgi:hypothetical protein